MSDDRTPPLADLIGKWTTPARSRLDLLAETDAHPPLAEALAMIATYRELLQAVLDQYGRQLDQGDELRARLRQALTEIDRLRQFDPRPPS
jgi:hypothetical protein